MRHAIRMGLCSRILLLIGAVAALALGACERKTERPAASSTEWREFEGSWNATGVRRIIPLGGDRKGSSVDLRGSMMLAGPGRPGGAG